MTTTQKTTDGPSGDVPSRDLLAEAARLIGIVSRRQFEGSAIWKLGTIQESDGNTVEVQLRMTSERDDFIS